MPHILKSISKYLKLVVGLIAVFVSCLSFADQIKIVDEELDWTYTISFNEVFFQKGWSFISFIGYIFVFLMGVFAVLSFFFATLPNKGNKLILTMNSLALGFGLLGFIFIALLPISYGEVVTCSSSLTITDLENGEMGWVEECHPDLVKFSVQSLTALIMSIVGFIFMLYTFIVELFNPQKEQVNDSSDIAEEENK